ncbi:MAG: HpsJ family protein [Roseofilum sp. SBFL]|uniref:HpsJ-like protein, cyanoexosortase A-associated n=1 Tax=unclassified Roseofilum TaxID=2620099 RepID=UPI001B10DD1A|nr:MULTISPECIES: HpsJ family protein [unclassified Roseofilum]MBP0011601.1 HpsJ family protein [Roseofilum sp. SID3]MBP0026663.1 HpsJ family protein [Roseofilum sp. SID2]MBP0040094.1 HpsJ family protein [Roseofilum sp. SID1]MBP0044033.1 HpsJ family protein [Roseofilum sp. SBFL]
MNKPKFSSSKPPKEPLIWPSETTLQRSESILHTIGYILLALAVVDYLIILTPLQLTNPLWEFQTIGRIVEHSPVPLIGLAFIFYRGPSPLHRRELYLLKILSWVCILVGILYFIIIPLGIQNALRLNQINTAQLNNSISQQQQQLATQQSQINQLNNEQLQNLLDSASIPDNVIDLETPEQLRTRLLESVNRSKEGLQNQAETLQQNQTLELKKMAIKFNLGAFLSGIAFMSIGYFSRWVRQYRR